MDLSVRRLAPVVTSLLLATVPLAANSEPLDGNTVYESCVAEGDDIRAGFCLGYLIGLVEGQPFGAFLVLKQAMPDDSVKEISDVSNQFFRHCIPASVSNRQIVDVVVGFLRDNPQSRHESARILALQAFQQAFPCTE